MAAVLQSIKQFIHSLRILVDAVLKAAFHVLKYLLGILKILFSFITDMLKELFIFIRENAFPLVIILSFLTLLLVCFMTSVYFATYAIDNPATSISLMMTLLLIVFLILAFNQ